MFAVRRSFFLLPCFSVPFLACCVLIFGTVSSMSLERHRREFQQQNDKQLELSEVVLPEAESEMLQSDMELVPAIDGKSDMYLLVPASAATSQEQSLQSLAELSDNQKFDNIEKNSDMLMQESEHTPAAQVLELPENDMETRIHSGLVEGNELSEDADLANEGFEPISERMVNTIAEAAPETQNEIETELERNEDNQKIRNFLNAAVAETEEQENHEQEMIGVVLEELNKTPGAADTDTESLQETEEQPIGLQSEKSEEQQDNDQLDRFSSEEHSIDSENTEAGEESSVMGTETENSEEIKSELAEANQVNEEPNEDYNQKDETEEQQSGDETREILESEETDQITQSENKKYVMGKHQSEEELKASVEDTSDFRDEAEMKLDEIDTEETREETGETPVELANESPAEEISAENIQSSYETQHKTEPVQDDILTPTEETLAFDLVQSSEPASDSLVEPLSFAATENAEEIDIQEEPSKEAEPNFESQHDVLNDLSSNEPSSQVEQIQLNSESFIDENPTSSQHLSQEEKEEESTTSKLNEGKDKEQIEIPQSGNEDQDTQKILKNEQVEEIMEVSDIKELQSNQDEQENADHIESSEGIEVIEESQDVEDTENADNLSSNEEAEPDQDIQPNEDKTMWKDHSMEENKKPEEILQTLVAQTQEGLPIENSLTFEEPSNGDDTAAIEPQPVENSQSVELHQAIEGYTSAEEIQTNNEADTKHITESIEESELNKSQEVVQSIEPIQATGLDHSVEEVMKTKEQQIGTEIIETDEIQKSEQAPLAMESLIEETAHEEDQSLFSSVDVLQTETPEFFVEEKDSELVPAQPAKITPEASHKPEEQEQNVGHVNVLADDNSLQSIESNERVSEQNAAIETQKPLNGIGNIVSSDKAESDPEREATTVLTTIEQNVTDYELTQQQQQHDEQEEEEEEVKEQQLAVEETVSSSTLRPLNVLDSVLNYVNGSLMNQMGNDNVGDHKQETETKQQVFSSKLRRYDGAQVWRIVVQNERERKLADELQTKYDGQLWKEVKQEVDYLLKPQVLADAERHVRATNLSRIVLIDNLQKVIEVENPPAEEIEELQNRKGSRLTWQAYHRLDDIHSYFDAMAKIYPDLCSVEVIGYSIEKRPLKVLKISNGKAENPGIWIDGGMHAREWISPAVVTFIANQIVEGWDDLPAYLRNINWYIHAVANPDGYEYSHTTDRLWRKNMRSHGRACPGVDLNRNFGYKWGGKGTSANPCSQTYRGSKAFSEPETFYISKFISNFPRETFKAYLSFHSYGQYILYPWGYDYHITKDMADLDLVARQAGTIITKSTGAKFTVGSSANTLYPAAGGSDDWAKGIAGIKYSYTVEMGDTGRYGFVLPAEFIESNGKNGFTVVKTIAKAITMGKNARRRKLKAHRTH